MVPTVNYPGNKNIPGLIQKIVNQIPVCKYFYEPFAGSAAVSRFLSVLPGINTIFYVNDIDPAATANISFTAGTKVTTDDGFTILSKLQNLYDCKAHFVFIDPPYHHSTRPNRTTIYKHEFSHTDHLKLIESVLLLDCNCMIIHPVCDLYNQVLHTFRTVQITIRYHNKTSIENLYMNYPRPEQLLTYACAGTDCWDRQRIKRKGDRLVQKLTSLPAVERNYIIDRILHTFKT